MIKPCLKHNLAMTLVALRGSRVGELARAHRAMRSCDRCSVRQ